MQFLDNVEREAAEAFRRFLKSEDPAARFPGILLNVHGTAMLQLLDNKHQLEKLMDVSDYAGELLSVARPAPGVPHSPSTQPSSQLHTTVQTRIRGEVVKPLVGLTCAWGAP